MIDISIVKSPDKVVYYVGEKFDATGLSVKGLYSDGSSEFITQYSMSFQDGSFLNVAQDLDVVVSSEKLSTMFKVSVIENKAEVISVSFPEYQDLEGVLVYCDKTFTAKTGFMTYVWWLDSTKQNEMSNKFILETNNLKDGNHALMVIVKDGEGNKYSASAVIKVTREVR